MPFEHPKLERKTWHMTNLEHVAPGPFEVRTKFTFFLFTCDVAYLVLQVLTGVPSCGLFGPVQMLLLVLIFYTSVKTTELQVAA